MASPHYGQVGNCSLASNFSNPHASWTYSSSLRKWTKLVAPLNGQITFLPGTYRFHVRDNQGNVTSSLPVVIARSGYDSCLCLTNTDPSNSANPRSGAEGVPENGFDPSLDPGFLTGTWIPRGTSRYWVVDQSFQDAEGGFTWLPGCVNQVWGTWSCPSYLGAINLYKSGTIISIRYRTKLKIPENQVLSLHAATGSGIPAPTEISFSVRPGDFSAGVPAACRARGLSGTNPRIIFGSTACRIGQNQRFYLNIRTLSDCPSEGVCRYMVNEPTDLAN